MPTYRRFRQQNWLLWQRTLTDVQQFLYRMNFFSIDGVNARTLVETRALVAE